MIDETLCSAAATAWKIDLCENKIEIIPPTEGFRGLVVVVPVVADEVTVENRREKVLRDVPLDSRTRGL